MGSAELTPGRDAAEEAVRRAVGLLSQMPLIEIDLEQLLALNGTATNGEVGLLRTHDVPEYGYIAATEVRSETQRFADRLRSCTPSSLEPNAFLDLLFDIHWSVDLRGHDFLDGCGRTALLLASWLSWMRQGFLLNYPSRERYLRLAVSADPFADWRREMRQCNPEL